MTKVYVAGAFEGQARLRKIRARLEQQGIEVTSTWLDEVEAEGALNHMPTLADSLRYAVRDKDDIWRSEAVLVDTLDTNTRGGREVEFGLALGWHLKLATVGPPRNVFHQLADRNFRNWEDALSDLSYWLTSQS